MYEKISEALLKIFTFSEEEVSSFNNSLIKKEYKKGESLLRPDEVCRGFGFINSGSFRQCTNTEPEITLNLFIESDWVADYQSFVAQRSMGNYIQACENAEVLFIGIHEIHELIGKYPSFFVLGTVMEKGFKSPSEAYYNQSPDDRYRQLLETHPEWINRFPQRYIASYLSMTPETLSRVRGRLTKKA